MKKLVTLLLVLTGFVCSAKATILHIGMEYNTTGDVYVYRFGHATKPADTWDNELKATFEANKYGRRWYTFDIDDYPKAVIRFDNKQKQTIDIESISGDDFYVFVHDNANSRDDGKYWVTSNPSNPWWWSGLCLRNTLDNNFNEAPANMDASNNNNTFTKTFTKEYIDEHKGANSAIWFRLKHTENQFFDENGNYYNGYPWLQIYPNNNNTALGIASSTSTYLQGTDVSSTNSWQLDLPSYDYEDIEITANYAYNESESKYMWTISADAHVSVTTNANGYRTFVVAAPLTISDATAYYAKDNNNGSATAIAISNPPASTPMLIKGGNNQTYSFKVAASGTALKYTNAFQAGTGETVGSGDAESGYNYILNGDKFYAANDRMVAEGKAYLQLSAQAPANARVLVFEDEESTGIGATLNDNGEMTNDQPVYNLAGQRVGQPTKGLYIVNGKKVIIK